jgi:ketosteroid isomerase-like protein
MFITMSPRLACWRDAWQSLDAQRIVALYTDDAVHQTPPAARIFPDNKEGRLAGREAIAQFVTIVCQRLQKLEFIAYRIIETGEASIMEYRRILNGDVAGAVDSCEVILWRGDQVQESRVYHA